MAKIQTIFIIHKKKRRNISFAAHFLILNSFNSLNFLNSFNSFYTSLPVSG